MSVTVTTVVTDMTVLGWSVALGGIVTVALILFLVQRELAAATGHSLNRLARNLTVAILPLLVTFGIIVVRRLASFL